MAMGKRLTVYFTLLVNVKLSTEIIIRIPKHKPLECFGTHIELISFNVNSQLWHRMKSKWCLDGVPPFFNSTTKSFRCKHSCEYKWTYQKNIKIPLPSMNSIVYIKVYSHPGLACPRCMHSRPVYTRIKFHPYSMHLKRFNLFKCVNRPLQVLGRSGWTMLLGPYSPRSKWGRLTPKIHEEFLQNQVTTMSSNYRLLAR